MITEKLVTTPQRHACLKTRSRKSPFKNSRNLVTNRGIPLCHSKVPFRHLEPGLLRPRSLRGIQEQLAAAKEALEASAFERGDKSMPMMRLSNGKPRPPQTASRAGGFRRFPAVSGGFRRFPAVSGGFRRFPAGRIGVEKRKPGPGTIDQWIPDKPIE